MGVLKNRILLLFVLSLTNSLIRPHQIYNADINNLPVQIVSTSECGISKQEKFCLLTGTERNKENDCGICDASNETLKHPISFAVDSLESGTFWKSANFEHKVNITISYGLEVLVKDIRLTMGPSPRPRIWILEKSTDYGNTFVPWRYFADGIASCWEYAGRQPSVLPTTIDEVICTTKYADFHPLYHGEIFLIPETIQKYPRNQKKQLFTATDIRFRLEHLHTLRGEIIHKKPSFTQRLFYSLTNIHINAECNCNGFECQPNNETRSHQCQCKNNTCGKSCSDCCPGFRKIAKDGTHGDFSKFACEEISTTTSPSSTTPASTTTPWSSCGCHPLGSKSGECSLSGFCTCFPQFTNKKCDRCQDGFWNFPVCLPCDCIPEGTLSCNVSTGECICKRNYEGFLCSKCIPGTTKSGKRCVDCACDEDGSVSNLCDTFTGSCICREYYEGPQCNQCTKDAVRTVEGCISLEVDLPKPSPTRIVVPVINFTYVPRIPDCNCSSVGSVNDVCDSVSGECHCKEGYSGLKCDIKCQKRNRTCSLCDCNPEGSLQSTCRKRGQCFCKENVVGFTCDRCEFEHWDFPNCKACNCNEQLSESVICNPSSGQCKCKANSIGLKCDRCADNFIFNGDECVECGCNENGTMDGKCNSRGECVCKHQITGKLCNRCRDNYWGFPKCKPCNCSPVGSLRRQCNTETGKCLCKQRVIGDFCDSCQKPKEILMKLGCIECDSCTDVLMNEVLGFGNGVVDQIDEMKHCNITELQLLRIEYLKEMRRTLHENAWLLAIERRTLSSKIGRLNRPEDLVLFLEDKTRLIELKSIWLEVNASRIFLNLTRFQREVQEIKDLTNEVQDLIAEIIIKAKDLNTNRAKRSLTEDENEMLKKLLQEIRKTNFSSRRSRAESEKNKVRILLSKWEEVQRYPKYLVRNITDRLIELNENITSVKMMLMMVKAVIPQIKRRLSYMENIRINLQYWMDILERPKELISVASNEYLTSARNLRKIHREVETKKNILKDRISELMTPALKELVRRSVNYSDELEHINKEIHSLLTPLMSNKIIKKIEKIKIFKNFHKETSLVVTDMNGKLKELNFTLSSKEIIPSPDLKEAMLPEPLTTDDSDYSSSGYPSGDYEVSSEPATTSTAEPSFFGWWGDEPYRKNNTKVSGLTEDTLDWSDDDLTRHNDTKDCLLIHQTKRLHFTSESCLKKGKLLQNSIKDVRNRLAGNGHSADSIQSTLTSATKNGHLKAVLEQLHSNNDLERSKIQILYNKALNVCDTAIRKCSVIDKKHKNVMKEQGDITRSMEEYQRHRKSRMDGLKGAVDDSLKKVFEVKDVNGKLNNRLYLLEVNLKRKIEMVQEKIRKVKQLASRFKSPINMSSPGFIAFNPTEELSIPAYSMKLQVSFMSEYKDGTILSSSPSGHKLRLYFGLRLSKPEIAIGIGNFSKNIILDSKIAIGEWYRLLIQRIGSELTVRIFQGEEEIAGTSIEIVETPPLIQFSLPIFIGGYPEEMKILDSGRGYFSEVADFDGALDDFYVNDKHVGLLAPDFSRGAQETRLYGSVNIKRSASFRDKGYLKTPLIEELTSKYLNLELRFKSNHPNGLLVHFQGPTKTRFLSLWLQNGAIHYIYHDNGENATMTSRRRTYNNGLWHSMQLLQKENRIHLILDGSDKKGTVILYWDRGYRFTTAIYGGLDKTTKEMIPHKYRNNYQHFVGCIENVIINKVPQIFQLDDNYKEVILGSCIQPMSNCACLSKSTLKRPFAVSLESVGFEFRFPEDSPLTSTIVNYQTSTHYYIHIYHKDDQVVVEIKDRHKYIIQNMDQQRSITDGKWHSAMVRFQGPRCTVSIDGVNRSFKTSINKDGFHHKLDFGTSSDQNHCIRNVIINDRFFDLSELAENQNWTTCRVRF